MDTVYIAFNKDDDFWKNHSKVLFINKGYNHLKQKIGDVGTTGVEVWETDRNCPDNVIYYSGHGRRGTPVMMPDAGIFVQFMIDRNIRVDRIVFLSCRAYIWLCRNYRAFAPLLISQQAILLEGSKSPLVMRNISPIVSKQKNETYIDFDGILLTRHTSSQAVLPQTGIKIEGISKPRYVTKVLRDGNNENPILVTANGEDFGEGDDKIK